MRVWILSDLHVTHDEYSQPKPSMIQAADLCICAGDTAGLITRSLDFLLRHFDPLMPIVTVLGNHDYFGNTIDRVLSTARKKTSGTNVHVLENDTLIFGNLRIIGATLWTDFEIPFGGDDEIPLPQRKAFAVDFCRRYMLDFREIFRSDWPDDGMPGLLTSQELISRHETSRAYIEAELVKPFDGKTVVLTHHAPSPRSLHSKFLGHPSNAAFASDLSDIIAKGQPDVWVHGHIHQFQDYFEGKTRVICNARGHRNEREINGFQPAFSIDL